ncbi:hypothetical protein QZH41_017659 [Actinostola sp. cb2023]|nr:hypothetical protein QZH41_017659 [Actinostola sp. cb2023]
MATREKIFGSSDESEEEFIGFTRSEIDAESDTESLGDSDISFSDSGSESSEREDENNAEEADQWSRNFRNVAVAPFVKPTGKFVMPRNRYLKINQYLHFNDSTTAFPREHDMTIMTNFI